MSDISQRGKELMNMASHLEEMLKYFNNGWVDFEKSFFEILLSSNYRPRVVSLEGKKAHYFAIDYERRKLIEQEKPHLICDMEALGSFGKLVESDGTAGAEAEEEVSGEKGSDYGQRDTNDDDE